MQCEDNINSLVRLVLNSNPPTEIFYAVNSGAPKNASETVTLQIGGSSSYAASVQFTGSIGKIVLNEKEIYVPKQKVLKKPCLNL